MILIFSSPNDASTFEVMDWLDHFKHKIGLVNSYKDLLEFYFNLVDNKLESAFNRKKNEEVKAFWFRRPPENPKSGNDRLNKFQAAEKTTICDFIVSQIKKKGINSISVNSYFQRNNKLNNLLAASNIGMLVPKSLITGCKKELLNFLETCGQLIVKPYAPVGHSEKIGGRIFSSYTHLLTIEQIEALPEKFAPSFFQEALEKSFEIRTFFLKDRTWSMAIFSQSNPKTSVDFRKYDLERPNRTVPYLLNPTLEEKIKSFMGVVGIDSGSLDFVFTKSGEIVFLEVNPIGQFGMVSHPCNYFLEEQIALHLIDKNHTA